MDLDSYRRSAEQFVSDLTAEYYRHFAGLKDSYEIEPIYARHADLFERPAVESLRGLVAGATPDGDERRRVRMLLDFAVEGHLGQATKEVEAELARREAGLSIAVDGKRVGFREAAVVQANEPDPARRAVIESARLELTAEQLNPLQRELVERQHATAQALGYGSYRELCAECKAIDLPGLRAQTAAFSAATEARYAPVVEPELERTLGLGLGELRRSDLPRFFRTADKDDQFPAARLVESFTETMRGLGIDLAAQQGVVLDVETRANKSPRAFCAPVRVPGEVYLVLIPIGGLDDYETLFHEGGHSEHSAHVDPTLPFEFRYLGDNAITEAYAFLFQYLVEDPEWLRLRLGVSDAAEITSFARAQRLVYLRRYAAKLAYELELHERPAGGDGLGALAERYASLLGGALRLSWPRETFLVDVDPGFYCACYLRAWALETHLRAHLRERFGLAWFEEREAGDVLRGLWRDGQRLTPDELLGELTGERLDFAAMADEFG